MKAAEIIRRVVHFGLKPLARTCGFRKSGLYFHRRLGEVVQVLHIQLSQSNFGSEGSFYVNIGLAFDRLWQAAARPVPEQPKEYECHFRRRLGELVEEPSRWSVSELTDRAEMGRTLARCIEPVIAEMDRIDSVAGFVGHPWMAGGDDPLLLARLYDSLCDAEAALECVQRAVATIGAGRWTVPGLIGQLHLGTLADLLDEATPEGTTQQ